MSDRSVSPPSAPGKSPQEPANPPEARDDAPARQTETSRSPANPPEARDNPPARQTETSKAPENPPQTGGTPPAPQQETRKEPADPGGKGGTEEKRGLSKPVVVIGALVLLAAIVAGILYWLHASRYEGTDDAYVAGHVHQISSRIAGTVTEVRVNDNQQVRTGDLLVLLDPRDNEVALQKANAQLAQADAQLGQQQAAITQARAQVLAADAQVAQAAAQVIQEAARFAKATIDFNRNNSLYQKDIKAISKEEVDTTKANFDAARGAYDGAKAAEDVAKAQAEASRSNLTAAEAQLAVAGAEKQTAESAVHDAGLQLSYCNVLAPVDGHVSKKTVEAGQRLQPGQALMAVVENTVWVLANLKETQLERVQVGQSVSIHLDALPHQTFTGTVDSFQAGTGATFALLPPDNATGNFTKIVQRVPVKIVFDEKSIHYYRDKIVPGLSAEPSIDLESHKSR